ncbi:MAG: VWA domain-containing protein [Thermoanaerobaculia bacterium]|nr:VWA domain-containing protein [Thermoanaerobaculia bacterium]
MRANAALLLSFLLFPASASAQFNERVDVNAVLIDAVVTDARGNQILGLAKDDFHVTENGVAQVVDSVDYFTTRRLLSDNESSAPFKVERVREERYIVFFFDRPQGSGFFYEIRRAREAVAEFIDRGMGEGDLVAIVGHDFRLKVYSDFTSDKKQLKRALLETAKFGRGLMRSDEKSAGPSILREMGERELVNETGTMYEALESLADSLRPIRARKSLVLFSPGIIEQGEEIRDGALLSTSRLYQPMIEALNAANVTVHAKNLNPNPGLSAVVHQTLARIADETNGEYDRMSLSYKPVITAMEKESGGYYLITYRSQKPRGARGFQKVEVKVPNPEFRVKARAGYQYGV